MDIWKYTSLQSQPLPLNTKGKIWLQVEGHQGFPADIRSQEEAESAVFLELLERAWPSGQVDLDFWPSELWELFWLFQAINFAAILLSSSRKGTHLLS